MTDVPLGGANNTVEPNKAIKKVGKGEFEELKPSNKLVSVVNPERVGDREPFVVYTVLTKVAPLCQGPM